MNPATKEAAPSPAIPRLAWSIDEVAISLHVSVVTVRRWLARGDLRSIRATRHIRISDDELKRFINQSPQQPSVKKQSPRQRQQTKQQTHESKTKQ